MTGDAAENSSWGGLHAIAGVSLLRSLGRGAKAAKRRDVELCLLPPRFLIHLFIYLLARRSRATKSLDLDCFALPIMPIYEKPPFPATYVCAVGRQLESGFRVPRAPLQVRSGVNALSGHIRTVGYVYILAIILIELGRKYLSPRTCAASQKSSISSALRLRPFSCGKQRGPCVA